jgi:serine protease Do
MHSEDSTQTRIPSDYMPRLARRAAIGIAVAAALTAATGVMMARASLPPVGSEFQTPVVVEPRSGLADLVEAVQPAVVSIAVETRTAHHQVSMPRFEMPEGTPFGDFFKRFFENPQFGEGSPEGPKARSAGSGFIVDPEGYVVTNNHVVKNADTIEVILDDGTRLPAELRGHDEKTDLALLKVDPPNALPYVAFGDSDRARPGDWVVAIGNPFGLGGTVTTGIISARGRDIQSGPYDDYLQIDAPINQGNSGGPLFGLDGKVIGINTAIYSPTGGSVGIGFAIPSDMAQPIIKALKTDGRVERGWLGVQIQSIDDALAEGLGLPDANGALVAAVTPGSPADKAGINVGDVIVGFDGKPIESMRELPRRVASEAPGSKTHVEVLRDGKRKTVSVELGAAEGTLAEAPEAETATPSRGQLGLHVAPLNEEARKANGLEPDTQGALVVEVAPGSPAARQGIQRGDIILRADGKPVKSPADLVAALESSKADEKVVLLLNREGNQWFLAIPKA